MLIAIEFERKEMAVHEDQARHHLGAVVCQDISSFWSLKGNERQRSVY